MEPCWSTRRTPSEIADAIVAVSPRRRPPGSPGSAGFENVRRHSAHDDRGRDTQSVPAADDETSTLTATSARRVTLVAVDLTRHVVPASRGRRGRWPLSSGATTVTETWSSSTSTRRGGPASRRLWACPFSHQTASMRVARLGPTSGTAATASRSCATRGTGWSRSTTTGRVVGGCVETSTSPCGSGATLVEDDEELMGRSIHVREPAGLDLGRRPARCSSTTSTGSSLSRRTSPGCVGGSGVECLVAAQEAVHPPPLLRVLRRHHCGYRRAGLPARRRVLRLPSSTSHDRAVRGAP